MIVPKTHLGNGFKGLMSYLFTGKDGDEPERVEWYETRNMIVDDPKIIPRVMRHTANQSTRCKKPVYHIPLSWHVDEDLTREQMTKAADRLLEELGLDDHQAAIVCHNDTKNPHVHIVVCRVHPGTGKAWSTSNDYKRIDHAKMLIEKEMGFMRVQGKHTPIDPTINGGDSDAAGDGEAPVAPPRLDVVKRLEAAQQDFEAYQGDHRAVREARYQERKLQRRQRRIEWLGEKAQARLDKQQARYDGLFRKAFSNPEETRTALERDIEYGVKRINRYDDITSKRQNGFLEAVRPNPDRPGPRKVPTDVLRRHRHTQGLGLMGLQIPEPQGGRANHSAASAQPPLAVPG